jgi:hypothetical protein
VNLSTQLPLSGAIGTDPQKENREFAIVDIDSRVTESNDVWWKYAWKLTLRNNSVAEHAFKASIEFQDKDGFVVDDDSKYGLVVPPNSEQVFTGCALIRSEVASTVTKTNAKVERTHKDFPNRLRTGAPHIRLAPAACKPP